MSTKTEEKLANTLIRVYERIKINTDKYEHEQMQKNYCTTTQDDVEYQTYCNVLEWLSWGVEFGVKTTLKIKEKENK